MRLAVQVGIVAIANMSIVQPIPSVKPILRRKIARAANIHLYPVAAAAALQGGLGQVIRIIPEIHNAVRAVRKHVRLTIAPAQRVAAAVRSILPAVITEILHAANVLALAPVIQQASRQQPTLRLVRPHR